RGRGAALGLVDALDVPVLRELGFVDQGRFSEWTFHRSMVRRWCEAWRSLFERQMPMRRAKRRPPVQAPAQAPNQEAR
ncbi:hypothetical protein, partial [Corallococcus sp. 4LFB]|uniref:hypothetical protein n=1 Tax=Corallococcus sp. 4LFB TaxID=3383249 RepID=UPI003975CFB7